MKTKDHIKQLKVLVGSDGCTSAPDFNFRDCCVEHDIDYRTGRRERRISDRKLRRCMQKKGWKVLPWIYWVVVRAIGWRFYKKGRPLNS